MADVTPLHRSPSASGGGDTGDEQQQAASSHAGAPPRIILHRIASYLSLGDAESMASLSRPSPHYYYSYSAATPSRHHHSSNSNISNSGSSGNNMGLMTGYHSLDYHFYHTIGGGDASGSGSGGRMNNNFRRGEDYDGNNSHVSLLGSNSSVGGSATAATSTQQQQQRQNSPNNNDDEEDWFVGGKGQTPGLVALSPLEEEFYGPGGVGGGGGGDNDGYNNLQNIPISTPAGQPTSESEGGGGGGAGSRMGITGILRSSSNSRRKMIDDSQHSDGENNNDGLNKRSSDDDNIFLDGNYDENDDDSDDLSFFIRREHSLRRQALQHKLAAAVFAHPYPLRQYCLDAYATATKLSMARQKQQQQEQQQLMATLEGKEPPPETSRDDVVTIMSPSTELHGPIDDRSSPELGEHQQLREQLHRHRYQHHQNHHHHQGEKRLRKQHQSRAKILRVIISKLLNNAPLSILLDIAESFCDLSLETLFATGKMGLFTIDKCIDILCNTVLNILDLLTSFNPFHIFEHVINLQRSAVGKTGDVVVSGIMSVATGVGSVSNAALNRLSRQGLALAGGVVIAGAGSRSGRSGSHDYGRSRKDAGAGGNPLDSKVSNSF